MSQFYHVTSLEELHRIYPNLQFDNLDGVSSVIQDDQGTQYIDSQGQQVITAVESSGMQFSSPSSSQQCQIQQPQFIVHQPAQYVIQHMDANESQQTQVQYIQQRPLASTMNKDENVDTQFQDQGVGCTATDIGDGKHTLKQCIVKSDGNQQYLSQIQHILHQPIQIQQQISTGANVVELQNQDQTVVTKMLNNQESTSNSQENQEQNSQITVQNTKQKQIITQTQENQKCGPQQIMQNIQVPHSVSQQQLMHQSRQQILQSVQYYNQLTVIDGFSSPNETLDQSQNLNETILQQQHVILPQEFDMSNQSALANRIPLARKLSQQEIDAPVFVVEEVEAPFLVREAQPKLCFQTSIPTTNKNTESVSTQSVGTQNEQTLAQEVSLTSRQEAQMKTNVPAHSSQEKFSKDGHYSDVEVGNMEATFGNKTEQMSKMKIAGTALIRPATYRSKNIEQQTEAIILTDPKNISGLPYPRFANTVQPRLRPSFSQTQSPSPIHPNSAAPGRGGGVRGFSPRGGHQYVPRARGTQVQTPPRPPNAKGVSSTRGEKAPRGGRGAKRESVSKGPDERAGSFVRAPAPQQIQTPNSKDKTCQVVSEPMEEARMVVLLGNGEKKIVKIPCSQNILIGQLLQQAGIPVSSNTPFTIEQVVDSNSDHFIIKSCAPNIQKVVTPLKGVGAAQIVTTPTSLASRSIVGTIQQRPRIQSPHTSHTTNISLVRHSLQFSPRMTNCVRTPVSSGVMSENQNVENSTTPNIPKEEPRYMPGLMAICPFCGISSLDFNKCIRCRRKLPENVKSHPIFCQKKKKTGTEKINISGEKECKSEGEDKQSDSIDASEKLFPGSDKKKPKLYPKKKKIHDEPTEILILSSDEEEDTKTKKTGFIPSTLSKLKKEPDYSDLKELEMAVLSKESSLSEDLMKHIQPGSFTTLHCRTIRIGSFKIQPKERVFVSAKGIRLAVTSLKNEPIAIIIPVTDIVKALIHFGKQIPVIFIYPLPKVAEQIRNMLGMDNKNGPYYDPTSIKEETHKRITILLEKVTEDNKIALHKVFGNGKLEELSEKEANEILLRASPVELQSPGCGKVEDNVRKIMVYPPPPEKGGITLNNQDYACLGEDQFLNDVIIDFYLKYLTLKVLSPTDRNRIHVFSTFFYKRLTTKPKRLRKNDPENDPKLSPAEKRHMRVKGWTKQVNLFEKDFIIVPINEHSHWFLAIICFPGLTGPVRFSDNTPVEPEEITPKKNSQTVQIGNTTITHIIKTDGNTISIGTDSGSDRDEAEGDQDDLHPSSDEESEQTEEESNNSSTSVQIPLLTPSQPPPPPSLPAGKDSKLKVCKKKAFREPIKQPCILIFDSLAGASRVRVVATLRDYLKIEYKKKMGQDRDFSKDTIKGAVPKVPQQNNFTDCGLYVLQYVESFFQEPLHDFKLPLKYLQDWFPEEVVSSKRQKLASLIRSLMEEQGINVEEMGLPQLTFGNGKNASEDQKNEEEEMEDDEELNEEEEEILRRYTHKNLSLEEGQDGCEEMEDDEDEDEEENEDFIEDENEDELEPGEISREWFPSAGSSCGEFETPTKHHAPVVFRTTAVVDYDPSDTGEEDEDDDDDDEGEQSVAHNSSEVFEESQKTPSDEGQIEKFTEQQTVVERRKTVPLIDNQDFESQITCTTIERSFDGSNCGSDSASEGEVFDDEEQGNVIAEEGSLLTYEEANPVFENFNKPIKTARPKDVLVKDGKTIEVTDIIKKLVSDKTITISRKEEELNSSLFKKHLAVKKFKSEDCDKEKEIQKPASPGSPDKRTLSSCKRSFQALKNVRIQKKAHRNLDLCSKRQKVDDR